MEWKKCTIADLGEVITGKTPTTKNKDYWGGDIQFITPKDLQRSKKIETTERMITDKGLKKVKSAIIPSGSVCVSCIGNIGYTGITTQKCVSNQQINSIIVNSNNDTDFVYYLLNSMWSQFKHYEGQSTTISILNKTQFSKIEVKVPSKKIQVKVAGILSALDKKIAFNQKINENLAA